MSFKDILSMSIGNLWRRKLRTFLTVLGVLIGTISIVAMVSLGIGMKYTMLEDISNFGSATQIVVTPGMSDENGVNQEATLLSESNMQMFTEMEHVESIDPKLTFDVTVKKGKYTGWVMLTGVPKEKMESLVLGEGKKPSDSDSKLEVVAGNAVLTSFYSDNGDSGYYANGEVPDIDVLNARWKLDYYNPYANGNEEDTAENQTADVEMDSQTDDTSETDGSSLESLEDSEAMMNTVGDPSQLTFNATITGVLEGGLDDYSDDCDKLLIEIENLKSYLTKNYPKNAIPGQPKKKNGQPYKEWIYSELTVNVDASENVETVMQNIQDMGFEAQSNREFIENSMKSISITEIVLGGIGMIAFLVAAIGIANTMMMSIYERTKEIGVMKVLGCDMRNIQMMFLSEAGIIGLIGGVFGLLIAWIIANVVNMLAATYAGEMYAHICRITWWLAIIAVVFSTLMGMLAGYFPSKRAMKLSALAAIRNE